MVKNQVEYDETIWDAPDAQSEKSLQAKLKRQAKQLGWGARMRMAWSRRPTTCGVDQAPPTTHLRAIQELHCPPHAAFAGHCQDSLATKHVSRFLLQNSQPIRNVCIALSSRGSWCNSRSAHRKADPSSATSSSDAWPASPPCGGTTCWRVPRKCELQVPPPV